MEFKLNINMDNAAFDVMPERELTAILTEVSVSLNHGVIYGECRDVNGNTIGEWEITED